MNAPVTPDLHLGRVVLVRHGESVANAAGMFTGVLDVPLSERGVEEARRAARLVGATGLRFDVAITSELERAWHTADVLARELSALPTFVRDWRLDERCYGALTGRTKTEVCDEVGEGQFLAWRRSVRVPPPPMDDALHAELAATPLFQRLPAAALPRTESLADVMVRVTQLWRERVEPVVRGGGAAIVVGHGNSLRALCGVLDALSDVEVQALGLPTGHPLLYELDPTAPPRDGLLVPLVRGGVYLDGPGAQAAAERLAREGGT
ncbi:phosphoglycerate mutase [Serinibacter arcticus]|uniref:2,3-bisphosphoglycerate-dependent phosphoglycerate mutase n=1 Tax=Serinibacter arcticus TaxID=1655435 RepID=A0A2U1ZSI0_9MICO|nr:2,3-bisphosphoglycerate-dependent phosphoglycerate mutase [Serinibacter arcticus]PWD49944.1 phosphoglycerate mutase [Serinibacter arcticus]